MNKSLYFILSIFLALQGCGEAGKLKSCVPNYEENGVGLLVSKASAHPTTFNIEVCSLEEPLDRTVTVYGVISEADLTTVNTSARWRFKNIDLNSQSKFTVEFALDDNYFAIFQDAFDGTLEANTKIIHGVLYQ